MAAKPYEAYGGPLNDLVVSPGRAETLKKKSIHWPGVTLHPRQISELTLLMNGGFSPLTGFMEQADYQSVLDNMRLADGTLWPIPICLGIKAKTAEKLNASEKLALLDPEGFILAVLHVTDIWPVDKEREAARLFGTTDIIHPGVAKWHHRGKEYYAGGMIEGIQHPIGFAFRRQRHTPKELRRVFSKLGWRRIVGFHTHNPLHRLQYEATLQAMEKARASLLLHPVVEQVRPGEIDAYTRVRCYLRLTRKYPPHTMMLSLLPMSRYLAGPREALLHAIVRRNFGCTHFAVGRRHADPGGNGCSNDYFYEPGEAVELALAHETDLGIGIVPLDELVYSRSDDTFIAVKEKDEGQRITRCDDRAFHQRFREGKPVPKWFTFPDVVEEMRKACPERHKQGITIFCTGLSGAGKSTIAKVLHARFLEMGGRPVTLLDGDIVRRNLSSELGFSKAHRDLNVRRIGFVAGEITKNRGIAICAPIAPYAATRRAIREQIEQYGGFIEVHVNTPIEVCEARDRKGLYAKARAGKIKGFTGVDDPYESPEMPEIMIDTTDLTPDEAVQDIMLYLERAGYIK